MGSRSLRGWHDETIVVSPTRMCYVEVAPQSGYIGGISITTKSLGSRGKRNQPFTVPRKREQAPQLAEPRELAQATPEVRLSLLASSPSGLSLSEAAARLRRFGPAPFDRSTRLGPGCDESVDKPCD